MGLVNISVGLQLFIKSLSPSAMRLLCIFNPITRISRGLDIFRREDLGLDELKTSDN